MCCALLLVTLLLAGLPSAEADQDARFQDRIEVTRIITEVRVVDLAGNPITGLGRDDFVVSVGGAAAEVEAVDWVASTSAPVQRLQTSPLSPQRLVPPVPPGDARAGRLIVMVFQGDLQFASVRVSGLIRMSHYATQLLQQLTAGDRVALAVFVSHLELHSDFTDDFARLAEQLAVTDLLASYQRTEQLSSPSLAEHFDVADAQDAATMSQALEVLGNALAPIPGPKSIVLFGWGIGRYGANGVWLGNDYVNARYALASARTTVFSLDITTADYHTLEVGLQAMARGTGGFYIKTHIFPQQAVTRLARVISGYYELSIVQPAQLSGFQAVDIEVPGHPQAQVLSRPIISLASPEPEET